MGMLISLYVCMLYRYIQLVITKTSSTKMARAGSSDNPTIVTSAHAHLIKQSVWRRDVQTIAQILFMSLTNAALLAVCFLVLTSIHFSIFCLCVSVCPEIFIVWLNSNGYNNIACFQMVLVSLRHAKGKYFFTTLALTEGTFTISVHCHVKINE